MKLTSNLPVAAPTSEPTRARKQLEVKDGQEDVVDIYNSARSIGNATSGVILGTARETVATIAQAPCLAWEIAENVWQTEKWGPNLKVLTTIAALPAAALSIAAAPFYGAYKGFKAADRAQDKLEESSPVLTPDASAGYAKEVLAKGDKNEPTTMSGGFMKELEEFGDAKLAEGEKPTDVRLLAPINFAVGGVVSMVVSGAVGLATGLVAGAITMGKDVKDAFVGKDMSLAKRAGKALASPINLVAGPVLGWKALKEATPRGFADGWEHGMLKPIVDTAKISSAMGAGVIKEAWEK